MEENYLALLRDVLETGTEHDDRTGVGTLSKFGMMLDCGDVWEEFPLLTTKKIPLRWVFEELMWFISGSTSESDLRARGVDIWAEWATEEKCAKFGRPAGDLGPVYGALWRSFPTPQGPVDQIARVIDQLRNTPNSRRIMLNAWHPSLCDQVELPPCHYGFQCKVEGHKVHMNVNMRSADLFLGVPFNIASYALLLHMLADQSFSGLIPGTLKFFFGDTHIYLNHLPQVRQQLSREPLGPPTLRLKTSYLSIEGYKWSDVELDDYSSHPSISAEVAV